MEKSPNHKTSPPKLRWAGSVSTTKSGGLAEKFEARCAATKDQERTLVIPTGWRCTWTKLTPQDLPPAESVAPTDSRTAETTPATDPRRAEYDKTIAELMAVIERDSDHAREAYVKRGEAYRLRGNLLREPYIKRREGDGARVKETASAQFEKALADFTAALRLAPEDANVYFQRALAYLGKEDYHRGLADYTEAVRLDPQSSEAHNSLARLCAACPEAKLRDGKKAVEHAHTACRLTD